MNLFTKFRESLRDGVGEKLIVAAKVLVEAAHSQARCFHYAGDAGTAQPLSTDLASGIANDTLSGSRFAFRFVAHTCTIGLYR